MPRVAPLGRWPRSDQPLTTFKVQSRLNRARHASVFKKRPTKRRAHPCALAFGFFVFNSSFVPLVVFYQHPVFNCLQLPLRSLGFIRKNRDSRPQDQGPTPAGHSGSPLCGFIRTSSGPALTDWGHATPAARFRHGVYNGHHLDANQKKPSDVTRLDAPHAANWTN